MMANTTSQKRASREEALQWAIKQMEKDPITAHKIQKKEFHDPNLTLKPNMEKTLKKQVQKKYHHTGKWEQRRGADFKPGIDENGEQTYERPDSEDETLETDEQWNWSCCASTDKNSKGCVISKKDKHKWILSSH